MGYRELLKRYIRFVEAQTGESYIDAIPYAEFPFSDRDVRELKALAAELDRWSNDSAGSAALPRFNHRLRLLSLCYGLTLERAAELGGIDVQTMRRWRTNPRSKRYVEMQEADFARFEHSLFDWLECQRNARANEALGI